MSHQHDNERDIHVDGMHCSGCALGIENHLRRLGLNDVAVDYANSSVSYSENSKQIPREVVISEIEKLGYKVKSGVSNGGLNPSLFERIEIRFLFCLVFTLPLLLHMILESHLLHNEIFQLALTLPVFLVGTLHFGSSALRSIRSGTMNMDVLIFVGSSAAFIYSLIGTIFGLGADFLFYETSASIITLVLLGNVIEKFSVRKTSSAIEELSRMQVSRAKVIEQGETILEKDASSLVAGELVLVNTGDRIPCDSKVEWGDGTVDESMLTGESLPIEKRNGDKVYGGTVLVGGTLKIRTTEVGDHTVLASIIKLVRDAQKNKPSIQKLGDQVSAVFVPAVLLFSALTFICCWLVAGLTLTSSLLNSIAVLVIACPCAMGLATPTAVMAGLGRAVKEGVLIRGGDTIEKTARLGAILFDKTGTLTTGKFTVSNFNADDFEEAEKIIGGIETHSSHPVAKSLAAYFKARPAEDFTNIEELRGLGMKASDKNGNRYLIGSFALVSELTKDSSHHLYVAKNERIIATLDIKDEIKTNAPAVIADLKSLSLKTVLVSGDSESKCSEVARLVGIDEVYAQQLPEQKLQKIENFQRTHHAAFVGDGINDAPALAKAYVGISLSNASEVAIQSAQVVLMNGNLDHLVSAILISRRTLKTIKQNLFWAFFYNIIAIPIAAAGFLTPTVAAFTMAFSDVIVIGNSLRLRAYNPRGQAPFSPKNYSN